MEIKLKAAVEYCIANKIALPRYEEAVLAYEKSKSNNGQTY